MDSALRIFTIAWLLLPPLVQGQIVVFTQQSSPVGIVSTSSNVNSGTDVTSVTAPDENNGLYFTQWSIDGVRQEHTAGGAKNPFRFTIFENTQAVAEYVEELRDIDLDNIPDWFELRHFGDLSQGANSNSDGDAHSLLDEFRLALNPHTVDEFRMGGLQESISATVTAVLEPGYVLFAQSSSPAGAVDATTARPIGSQVQTLLAPDLHNDSRFTRWDILGVLTSDFAGSARRQVNLTLTTNIQAVAEYLSEGQDADNDNIPDWFEIRSSGTTNFNPNADPDLDAWTLREEFNRELHPGLKDEFRSGGLASGISATTPVTISRSLNYTVASDPDGLYAIQAPADTNTVVTTPVAPDEYLSLKFAYWSANDVRQRRFSGEAQNPASTTVTTNIAFVAHYLSPILDDDGDNIADWLEQRYLGNLSANGSSDLDGDGIPVTAETFVGLSPLLKDTFRTGGLAESLSEITTVDLQFFPRETQALEAQIVTHIFSEDPTTPDGWIFGAATHPALGDWDGDEDLDLLVLDHTGVLSAYENTGSKYALNLVDRSPAFNAQQHAGAIAMGDWNQDGLADIGYATTNRHCLGFKASSGNFTSPISGFDFELVPTNGAMGLAFGDMDDDQRPDVVALMMDGRVNLYPHNGNNALPFTHGLVTTNILGRTVPDAADISVADVNFDDALDILISDSIGRVWEFRASGNTFILHSRVWAGTGAGFADNLTLTLSDLDADGDVDAIAGFEQGGLMLLRDPAMARPLNLQAFGAQDSVRLDWLPAYQSRIKGYNVYRSTNPNAVFDLSNAQLIDVPRYLDEAITGSAFYHYHVTAVTEFFFPGFSLPRPVESPASEIVQTLAGSTRLSLADYCGNPGEEAVLQINVDHIDSVIGDGMSIRISYDPAVVTPITQITPARSTVLKTPLSAQLTLSDNSSTANGELIITATGQTPLFGNGHLFDLVFEVSASVLAGSTSSHQFNAVTLRNTQDQTLPADFSDTGLLHIETNFLRGDIDANGLLDTRDLTLLMRLAAGFRLPTSFEIMATDLNGNGRLDAEDAHLLSRLIQGLPLHL